MPGRLVVRSQLPHEETGGILDDCGPASAACAASWVTGKDISAGEGIAAKKRATGAPDRPGVSDNGSSLAQLAKTVKELGARSRYPDDWQDATQAAKTGAALIINVQAPRGYPDQALSKWHRNWVKYWNKHDPLAASAGYGHMIAVAFDSVIGWQLADPTFSGKGKEKHAAVVSAQDVRAVASGKGDAPHKRVLVVERRAP
jgi:hypothetical protein